MRPVSLVFLFVAPLCAQPAHIFSAGVVGGGAFTSAFATTSSPQPLLCGAACYIQYSAPAAKPLVYGAAVEFRVTRRVSVEAEALCRRISYNSVFEYATPSSGLLFAFSKTTAQRWEIPLVGKYRFGSGVLRPFAAAGAAIDWINAMHTEADTGSRSFLGHVGTAHSSYGASGQMTAGPRAGVVLGGGVEARLGPLRISPQLRVTRWIRMRVAEPDLRSRQTEAAALLTLMF